MRTPSATQQKVLRLEQQVSALQAQVQELQTTVQSLQTMQSIPHSLTAPPDTQMQI